MTKVSQYIFDVEEKDEIYTRYEALIPLKGQFQNELKMLKEKSKNTLAKENEKIEMTTRIFELEETLKYINEVEHVKATNKSSNVLV